MSKTWRGVPVGRPKDPRPPEKGGHKNLYKEAIEEEFVDFDDDLLLEIDDTDPWDLDELVQNRVWENEEN